MKFCKSENTVIERQYRERFLLETGQQKCYTIFPNFHSKEYAPVPYYVQQSILPFCMKRQQIEQLVIKEKVVQVVLSHLAAVQSYGRPPKDYL